jgi:hypothetical protein
MKLSPRAKRLLDVFLLTEEMWQKIHTIQKGLCAICHKPMRKPNCDHDHASGLVRGLLCARCNRALGRFGDSLALLQAAVAYLLDPPASVALGGPHYGMPGRVDTKKQRKLIKKRKKSLDLLAKPVL